MTTSTSEVNETRESALIPAYVGRQAIFDSNLEVRAYEILFRDSIRNAASFSDSDWATGRTFWNTFIEFGLDNVTEHQRAYLNVTPAFIASGCLSLFPPERIALEISANEIARGSLRQTLQDLVEQGFQIVIDGVSESPLDGTVYELARTIKLDASTLSEAILQEVVESHGGVDLTLIAKNIETFEKFETCRKIGFHGFQGHFLSKPQIVTGGRIPADGLARMRLLAAVNDAENGVEKLEEVIEQDVGLCYKLLRYVNSAMFSLPTEIESIRHAIMIIGETWMRTWANLVILSAVPDKPQAIFSTAVLRGKMCELLGEECGAESPQSYFTTGLLSTLDLLLDRPLSEILPELPLSNEIRDALLRHEGPIGEVLSCVLQYEQSAWDAACCQHLKSSDIRDAYIASLCWTAELRGNMRS